MRNRTLMSELSFAQAFWKFFRNRYLTRFLYRQIQETKNNCVSEECAVGILLLLVWLANKSQCNKNRIARNSFEQLNTTISLHLLGCEPPVFLHPNPIYHSTTPLAFARRKDGRKFWESIHAHCTVVVMYIILCDFKMKSFYPRS
jgi:hypothetical protein